MLPVWASTKQRSQQRRPPFQHVKQPSMAPVKKKATAGTTSTSTEPGRNLDGPQPRHEGVNPQMEDINNETAPHGDQFDNTENTEAHQLTETALKLKALEMKKNNMEAQLATKKRAMDQDNKLAEARRRLAEMEAEVESLQRAYQEMPEGSSQQENRVILQTSFAHNENQRPPPVNLPFDPTSPLSVALQRTSWPLGYKPTQLPKYATTDPTQFLMAYKATIASAGGDDSTMAKSFVMACEGSVANWYSYLPPQSINNWYQLKGRLLQDFQGFRRLTTNTVKDFKCPQHDREPLYDYFRRFVQKKAQIPNFPEKDAIEKCIEGLLPGQLASHLIRKPPRTLDELYTEAEKYAKSDADHRRRVEQRRIMRQAEKYN